MNYRGSCHCGTIAYEVEGDLDQVIQCNCSLCSRRGWLLWFVPRDRLALKTPASAMHTYTFNTHRLQHHFCPTCGCAPFSEGIGPDGQAMAAVNARCLEDIDATPDAGAGSRSPRPGCRGTRRGLPCSAAGRRTSGRSTP